MRHYSKNEVRRARGSHPSLYYQKVFKSPSFSSLMINRKICIIFVVVLLCGCTAQEGAWEDTTYYSSVDEITHIMTITMPTNWDADAEDDGIEISIIFLDYRDLPVTFSDTAFLVSIKLYTMKHDENYEPVRGTWFYKANLEARNSDAVEKIRIPYEKFPENFPEWAWLEANVQLKGTIYESIEETVIMKM